MTLQEIFDLINKGKLFRLQSKEYANWLISNKGYITIRQLQETTNGKWALLGTHKNKDFRMIFHFLSNDEIEKTHDGTWLIEYLLPSMMYADTDNIKKVMPNFNELYKQKMEEKKMKNEKRMKVMWKGTATILFRDGKRISVAKVHGEEFDRTKGFLMCIWKTKFTHSYMKSTLKRRHLEGSQDAELAILYERAYMITHLDDDMIKRIAKSAKEDKKLDCWYAEF